MMLSRFVVRGTLLSLVLFLSGCSMFSGPEREPVPVDKKPDYTVVTPPATAPQPQPRPQPRPVEPAVSAAYQPLMVKAGQATARGDYDQALALLERAQRIAPDSAEIYLGMAKTHRARGDMNQARATAERGLLYCNGGQCDALRAFTR